MRRPPRVSFARPQFALLAAILLAPLDAALAAPDIADKFPLGAGGGTDHKPQSKLWFNDGSWWTIAHDGTTQRIWKFDGGMFVKQTDPDAAVDGRATARTDALWDGTHLYVLVWHEALPRFTKYSYDSSTQTYARLPGFPIDLPIADTEVMVIDKDSTDRVWVTYEIHHEIHVIWTTSPDHLSWNTTGTILEYSVDSDDISTVVAFGGDAVGVLWSDQSGDPTWQFGFRMHRDSDPPELWQPIEVVDTGSAVDDHINLKAAPDGRLFLVTKNVDNHANLYVRQTSGSWNRVASNLNDGACTRPVVQVDTEDSLVHVFYTDWIDSPNPIKHVTAPLSTMAFGTPETFLIPAGLSLNDVSGTKQVLTAGTGIMAIASSSSSVYWGFDNLDTDEPTVTGLDPADETAGVPLQPLIQVRVADAGMGVRRSSISMTLDGVPITPTIAGSAAAYLLTWTPPAPLDNGRIYTVSVTAEDYAYPPHTTTDEIRFRTAMLPVALDRKINFQPSTGATPAGYDADTGKSYTLERGSGWNKSVTERRANVDPDIRLDTYIERKNTWSRATWTYDLADGLYRVTFTVGAPEASGKQRVEVEGEELVANQSTAAGQFITISGYPIAVRDGHLDVTIGGGTSSRTQIGYIEFRYEGEAPPPPPSTGNEPAPKPVAGLVLARGGSDILLQWSPVTQDTTGALVAVTSYHVYRGANPDFTPDRSTHANRVGVVSSTNFTDLGGANAAGDLYYIVTAERASGQESAQNSNLGIRRTIALAPAGSTQTAWIALPYATSYGDARSLATSWNGGIGAGPVVSLARIDRTTQARQEWTCSAGSWSGSNFPIIPGEAVEVTVQAPLTTLLLGSESSSPAYVFAFNSDVGNVNWISLPQHVDYADARAVVESMNGGPGAGPITKVAWLNPSTAQMESFLYFAGAWRGTNFLLRPGQGIAILAGGDLALWTPRLH